MPNSLGLFLRNQRKRPDRAWSQKKVARKLGFSVERRSIGHYETGRTIPSEEVLQAYADLFECDVEILLELATTSRREKMDPTQSAPSSSRAQDPTADPSSTEIRRPAAPPPKRWPRGGIVLMLAIALGIGWSLKRSPSPTSVRLLDKHLEVLADQDLLWRMSFPNLSPAVTEPLLRDVDGDGRKDVLFAFQPKAPETETGRVACFDPTGSLSWEVSLGKTLRIRGRTFTPFFVPHHVRWIETQEKAYLVVVARHHRWYPTQVLLLDPSTGTRLGEYWHPGYLNTLTTYDVAGDGTPELLLGGVNNPDHGPGVPVVVVLDLPFGPSNGHNNLFGVENSQEADYLVFPRPDLVETYGELASVLTLERQPPHHLLVGIANQSSEILLFYTLGPDLTTTDLRATDTMTRLHNLHLDHKFEPSELDRLWQPLSYATAPDGNHPDVRNRFDMP